MLQEPVLFKKDWQKRQRSLIDAGVDCAYLYVHLEMDSGEPFYVGMGETYKRPWQKNRSRKHKNRANKHGQITHVDAAPVLSDPIAKWWEVRWIKAFRDAGYDLVNLTDGGEGTKGHKHTEESKLKMKSADRSNRGPHSEETKKLIAEKLTGNKNGFGKHPSDEVRKILSEKAMGNKKGLGKIPTLEHREKISKAQKGRKPLHIMKPVIEITDDKKFASIVDAANYYNISASSIGQVCVGKRKTAGKRIFKFIEEA